jgi:hypothetical protein
MQQSAGVEGREVGWYENRPEEVGAQCDSACSRILEERPWRLVKSNLDNVSALPSQCLATIRQSSHAFVRALFGQQAVCRTNSDPNSQGIEGLPYGNAPKMLMWRVMAHHSNAIDALKR